VCIPLAEATGIGVFFNPRSIAVIGASERPGTIGRAIMLNLLEKYRGKIYPVNVKYDNVFNLKCYRSITEIPDQVDVAVIAVPADVVPQVVEECGRKGVKGVIVISAGFREIGEAGEAREKRLVEIAKRYGVRVIGPNCLGLYDAYSGVDTIFNPSDRQKKPGPGNIAFISQSGALGAALLDWFAENNIGMSKFVSYGNAADVDEPELIEFLAEDEKTDVIAAYVEGVKNGRRFLDAIRKAVSRGKPVVILKAGRTSAGVKAAQSHTGSLAGDYAVFEAAVKQYGALVVSNLRELLVAIKSLSAAKKSKKMPLAGDVAIVTNGGGAGVLAADALVEQGLRPAVLSSETIDELRKILPSAASPYNPVDILGDATPERYRESIRIVSRDPNVGAIIVIALLQSPALDAKPFVETIVEISNEVPQPIVVVAPGSDYVSQHLMEIERRASIPTFMDPVEGVLAVKYLYEFTRNLDRVRKLEERSNVRLS